MPMAMGVAIARICRAIDPWVRSFIWQYSHGVGGVGYVIDSRAQTPVSSMQPKSSTILGDYKNRFLRIARA
jgi:hypothetical protein